MTLKHYLETLGMYRSQNTAWLNFMWNMYETVGSIGSAK